MTVPKSVVVMAQTYERDNNLPALCVLDFLMLLEDENWCIRRPRGATLDDVRERIASVDGERFKR